MSEKEAQQAGQAEPKELVMTGKVPYLAILGTLLKSSNDSESYFGFIDEMMHKDEVWDEAYNNVESDPLHKSSSYFSFAKTVDSSDLAVSCLILAASNTFSNNRKDVLLTHTTVYVTHLILEQVWKGKDKTFAPAKTLTREEFKKNVISLSKSGSAVIPVEQEMALLHGSFCKDTWNILSSIVAPVSLPKSAYRQGKGTDEVYGLMFMIGEAYEALAMLCDAKDSAWDEHIANDFSKIMLSFTKEEKVAKDNNVPSDKDK